MSEIFDLTDVWRILLAGLAGALIGLERHIHGRHAGMRTNMLVAAASAIIMLLSEKYYTLMPVIDASFIRIDPSRIAAGAITGIGFLGAGVIIKNRASVIGLTTAATIWMVSAIGLAFGAGAYGLGTAGFVLAVFSLLLMDFVEKRIRQARYNVLQVVGENLTDKEAQITDLLESSGMLIKSRAYRLDKKDNRQEIDFSLKYRDAHKLREAARRLIDIPQISRVSVRRHIIDD